MRQKVTFLPFFVIFSSFLVYFSYTFSVYYK